jgi:hypothetical protein
MVLRTSPANHQAWIAMTDDDAIFARPLRTSRQQARRTQTPR